MNSIKNNFKCSLLLKAQYVTIGLLPKVNPEEQTAASH